MYMPYLMIGYAIALLLMVLGCRVSARTIPGLRGIHLLEWSLISGFVAVLFLAARPWAPAWVTIILANQVLFLCYLLIYCSVADILDVPISFLPWGIALSLAALGGNCWYTYVHPDLVARILVSSGSCSVFAIATAVLLFSHAELPAQLGIPTPALRILTRFIAWLQVALAALLLTRCALTVLYPPESFVHLDLIQAGFSYLNLILSLAVGCGLLWFSLCAHRRELHTMARTDSLTGLLNRRAFEELLGRELRRADLGGPSVFVLLLDIDRFKQINDSFGHHAGDEVLRRISESLSRHMRSSDALARYGGEEFVMLLRDLPPSHAVEVAERLRLQIASLDALPGGVAISASIGMDSGSAGDSPEELLRRCDQALYTSKRRGRNCVTVHGEDPSAYSS